MNVLFGRIRERNYMGGEVSYYVELANGEVIHVISLVKRNPFKRGEDVYIAVDPENCRLLKKQE